MTEAGDPLERALYGFLASQVLFAADELGIFEHLTSGEGMSATALAAAAAVPADPLERLLTAAVSLGLLERHGDLFVLPAALRPAFRAGDPACIGARLGHLRDVAYPIAAHLAAAVREGGPQWARLGSGGAASPFASIYATRESTERFLDTMWALGHGDSIAILEHDPLPRARHLLDIGGGSGSFTLPALRRYPELRATVFDLAPVRDQIMARAVSYGVADRLEFVAGDMFTDPFPEADACALGFILSDWDDEQGTGLLARCHALLPPGGRVLVLERLFDDDKGGPLATAMMDLGMLLETHGRHRTEAAYRSWLCSVGFGTTGVIRSRGAKHLVWGDKDGPA
jgi:SAM-dependent methyltransferase